MIVLCVCRVSKGNEACLYDAVTYVRPGHPSAAALDVGPHSVSEFNNQAPSSQQQNASLSLVQVDQSDPYCWVFDGSVFSCTSGFQYWRIHNKLAELSLPVDIGQSIKPWAVDASLFLHRSPKS